MKRFFNLLWWRKKKRQKEFSIPANEIPPAAAYELVQEQTAQEDQLLQHQKSFAEVKETMHVEMEHVSTETTSLPEYKIDAFQDYIIDKFKDTHFELVERRTAKFRDDVSTPSASLPELEYHFKTNFHDFKIAIECKWKPDFIKGRVEWAKGHQMAAYRQYQQEQDIAVFVLIGIGGDPGEPRDFYIVPLKDIRSNVLSDLQLSKYRQDHERSIVDYFNSTDAALVTLAS